MIKLSQTTQNIFVGTDLVETARFKKIDYQSQFAKNIYTKREIAQCQKKDQPYESFAGRFAAKEAVRKTISKNLKFNQIEIISDKKDMPQVNFLDTEIKKTCQCSISITHTNKIAQAICLTAIDSGNKK